MSIDEEWLMKLAAVTEPRTGVTYQGILTPVWESYTSKFSTRAFHLYTVHGTIEGFRVGHVEIAEGEPQPQEVEEKLEELRKTLEKEYNIQCTLVKGENTEELERVLADLQETKQEKIRQLAEVQGLVTPEEFKEKLRKKSGEVNGYYVEEIYLHDAKVQQVTVEKYINLKKYVQGESYDFIRLDECGEVLVFDDFEESEEFALIKEENALNLIISEVSGFPVEEYFDIYSGRDSNTAYAYHSVTIDFGGNLNLSEETIEFICSCVAKILSALEA